MKDNHELADELEDQIEFEFFKQKKKVLYYKKKDLVMCANRADFKKVITMTD